LLPPQLAAAAPPSQLIVQVDETPHVNVQWPPAQVT
jgi:hypothetical protein